MAYTQKDIDAFNAAYPGVTGAEQFFGAPPAAPPVAPIDDGGLLAGNEKAVPPGQQDWLLDATGKPVGDIPIGLPTGPAPKLTPQAMVDPSAPVDLKAMTDAAYKQQQLAPARLPPAPAVPPQKAKPASTEGPAVDPDMAAAQALESGALGGGVVPSASRGVAMPSQSAAFADARALTGDKAREANDVDAKEEDARKAMVDARYAEGRAIAEPAVEYALAQQKVQELGDEIQAKQAEKAKAFQDSEAKIDAYVAQRKQELGKTSTAQDIGQVVAYALSAIGQGLMGSTGKSVDYVGQVVQLQQQSADREYAKTMDTIKRMKVSGQQRDELEQQAIGTLMAKKEMILDGARLGLERVKAISGGKLTEDQARAFDLATQAIAADNKAKRQTQVENVAMQLYNQRLAAAAAAQQQQGAMLQGKEGADALSKFVPTGANGQGIVVLDADDAKKLKDKYASVQAMDQNLANISSAIDEYRKMSITDKMDPRRISVLNFIRGQRADYVKNKSVAQQQGVVREWEQKDETLGEPDSLLDMNLDASKMNIDRLRGGIKKAVSAELGVRKAYDARKSSTDKGTAGIIPLGVGTNAAPVQYVPGMSKTK